MTPDRDPRRGLPDLTIGDNIIVPDSERPHLGEINLPPMPGGYPLEPFKAQLDRIERKLTDIDERLKVIEGKI